MVIMSGKLTLSGGMFIQRYIGWENWVIQWGDSNLQWQYTAN